MLKFTVSDPERITIILRRLSQGDASAQNDLYEAVYQELRRLAGWFMRGERPSHTLQPTALVHEAWLRMAGGQTADWQSRAHFFGSAARAMRRILIEHARRFKSPTRGGRRERIPLDENMAISSENLDFVLELDAAMEKLAAFDEREVRVVEMRFFAGMTNEEIALILGLSQKTIKRDWEHARLFLKAELDGDGAAG